MRYINTCKEKNFVHDYYQDIFGPAKVVNYQAIRRVLEPPNDLSFTWLFTLTKINRNLGSGSRSILAWFQVRLEMA